MHKLFKSKEKVSLIKIGFLQAAGVALYILLFASIVWNIEKYIPHPPQVLAAASFLLAFVISATVCGSLVLAYPATLALKGKIKDAFELIAWSAAWLLIILLSFVLIIVSVG